MFTLPVAEGTTLVCRVPVAPVSRTAAYSAEMTTQLVFGETCVVTGPLMRKWYPVRCMYDGYEGFVLKSQFDTEEAARTASEIYYTGENGWLVLNEQKTMLPIGAVLPGDLVKNFMGNTLRAGELTFSEKNITELANRFGNVAYLWGGKTSFGTDCSGFTQTVFRLLNIQLPRDAWQQAETGETIGFLQEARAGDLAFFDDEEGRIIHTGILLNDHEIIHAAGNVHTDPIDHAGILDARTGERTHRLRIIKRVAGYE